MGPAENSDYLGHGVERLRRVEMAHSPQGLADPPGRVGLGGGRLTFRSAAEQGDIQRPGRTVPQLHSRASALIRRKAAGRGPGER